MQKRWNDVPDIVCIRFIHFELIDLDFQCMHGLFDRVWGRRAIGGGDCGLEERRRKTRKSKLGLTMNEESHKDTKIDDFIIVIKSDIFYRYKCKMFALPTPSIHSNRRPILF